MTFGWTWTFELIARGELEPPHRIEDAGPLILVATFGPLLGALAAATAEHGVRGPLLLFARFGPLRGHWRVWLAAAYVLVPAALAMLVLFSVGAMARTALDASLLILVPIVGLTAVLMGPVGEEFGWRGLLLPSLLTRYTPLTSALLVGLIWGLWHAPLWSFDGFISGLSAPIFVPLYLASVVAMSVIMTVLHLRSSGSVAVAILAHCAFNAIVLPFDSLYADGLLRTAPAWPFTIAAVMTAVVVGVFNRRALTHRG